MKKRLMWGIIGLCVTGIAVGGYFYHRHTSEDKTVKTPKPLTDTALRDAKEMVQNRAEGQYKKRHFQTIITAYTAALKAAPGNEELKGKLAEAYYQLALIEQGLGNEENAKRNFTKALELDPNHAEARKLTLE